MKAAGNLEVARVSKTLYYIHLLGIRVHVYQKIVVPFDAVCLSVGDVASSLIFNILYCLVFSAFDIPPGSLIRI